MKPRISAAVVGALFVGLAAAPAAAQAVHRIVVESPVMQTGEWMPRDHSPDGRNVSPPLRWSDLPAGTRQIAVVCEDYGAGNPPPWVHWVIYNIPPTADGLPEGIPIDPEAPMPAEIAGAVQGKNGWGRAIYRGPAPPGSTVHYYNFVVYALDAELNLPPGLTRNELMDAIDGHVIGKGVMIPMYTRQPMSGAPS